MQWILPGIIYPDNMNILVQRWFPIGDIGVGVLSSSHINWLNIGFPLAIGLLALASYWHPIMV